MKKNNALDRSLDWIRNHPGAVNLDVPEDLVAEWIFEVEEEDTRPLGFYLSVFTFGYLQNEIYRSNLPMEEMRAIPSARLFECFDQWQMKLALVDIHRKTDVSVAPMPLFSFPPDEEIIYGPK